MPTVNWSGCHHPCHFPNPGLCGLGKYPLSSLFYSQAIVWLSSDKELFRRFVVPYATEKLIKPSMPKIKPTADLCLTIKPVAISAQLIQV